MKRSSIQGSDNNIHVHVTRVCMCVWVGRGGGEVTGEVVTICYRYSFYIVNSHHNLHNDRNHCDFIVYKGKTVKYNKKE